MQKWENYLYNVSNNYVYKLAQEWVEIISSLYLNYNVEKQFVYEFLTFIAFIKKLHS